MGARHIGLERKMRLAEAGREPGAENLHLIRLPRQPELDRMPVEARNRVTEPRGDCLDAKPPQRLHQPRDR
jgi:hypothetical protein